jgi:ElaA protein
MEQLVWKRLEEMDSLELYQILRLRCDIFILEQRCIYPECDDADTAALHLQYFSDGQLAAYLRLIPRPKNVYSIGRVVVRQSFRGQGIGISLLQEAIAKAGMLDAQTLVLNAQLRYRQLYERSGFTMSGAPFDEEGILHVPMEYRLKHQL